MSYLRSFRPAHAARQAKSRLLFELHSLESRLLLSASPSSAGAVIDHHQQVACAAHREVSVHSKHAFGASARQLATDNANKARILSEGIYGVAVQSDGKILSVGNRKGHGFAVTRYDPNGQIDETFGNEGVATIHFADAGAADAYAVIIDTAGDPSTNPQYGKILVAGVSAGGFAVARLNANGSIDRTFGHGGKVSHLHSGAAAALTPLGDGSIIVGGSDQNGTLAIKLDSTGKVSTSFGNNGVMSGTLTGSESHVLHPSDCSGGCGGGCGGGGCNGGGGGCNGGGGNSYGPPTVTIYNGPSFSTSNYGNFSANGSISDSNPNASLSATVDYGDGGGVQSLPLSGNTFTLNHQYTSVADDTISVNVYDSNDGQNGSTTATDNIYEPAPAATLAGGTTSQGEAYVTQGTISDPDPTVTSFTATADYGDGTGQQSVVVNGNTYTLDHIYDQPQTYPITLTVTADANSGNVSGQSASTVKVNPQPVISVLENGAYQTMADDGTVSVSTGQALFVDLQTTLPNPNQSPTGSQDDPLSTYFRWNFGDTVTDPLTGKPPQYNILPGFNAAHVYDTPGSYTLTLTATGVAQPTVLYVDVTTPQITTMYVSDSGTPTGSGSSTDPIDFTTAMHDIGSAKDTTFLLAHGQTFNWPWPGTAVGLNGSNVTLKSDDDDPSAAQPVITANAGSDSFFTGPVNGSSISNFTIQNIEFTCGSNVAQSSYPLIMEVEATNGLLIRDCTLGLSGGAATSQQGLSNGMLLLDNTVLTDGTPGYSNMYRAFSYVEGTDSVILGNTIPGSLNECTIRADANTVGSQGFDRLLIYNNELWNETTVVKADISIRTGAYAYIADNLLHANDGTDLSINLTHEANEPDAQPLPFSYAVVEDNYFGPDVDVKITSGVSDIAVRNNVFQMSGSHAVELGDSGSYYFGPDTNIQILNNTAYNVNPAGGENGGGSQFLDIEQPLDPTESFSPNPNSSDNSPAPSAPSQAVVALEDNLYVAPPMSSGNANDNGCDVYSAGDLSSLKTVSDNLWQNSSQGNEFYWSGSNHSLSQWNSSFGSTDGLQGAGAGNPQIVLDSSSFVTPAGVTYSYRATPILSAGQVSELNGTTPPVGSNGGIDFYGVTRTNPTIGAVEVPPGVPLAANASAPGTLSWSSPELSDVVSNVIGYNVYRSTASNGPWGAPLNGNTPISGTSYQDQNAGSGDWYYAITTLVEGYTAGGAMDSSANESLPAIVSPPHTYSSKIGVADLDLGWWDIDTNGNGVWDGPSGGDTQYLSFGGQGTGGIAVTGDWNGTGVTKIGIFRPDDASWALDLNGDGQWSAPPDATYYFGSADDLPVVGDWTGSGSDKIGIYRPSDRVFSLDMNGDFVYAAPPDSWAMFADSGVPQSDALVPVAGKWNGGAVATVGLWDETTGTLYLDTSGAQVWGDSSNPATVISLPAYKNTGGAVYQIFTGDWNGDGKTDIGFYTASGTAGSGTFYLLDLSGGTVTSTATITGWGSSPDQPISI